MFGLICICGLYFTKCKLFAQVSDDVDVVDDVSGSQVVFLPEEKNLRRRVIARIKVCATRRERKKILKVGGAESVISPPVLAPVKKCGLGLMDVSQS